MRKACLPVLFVYVFLASSGHAATKVLTVPEMIKDWAGSVGKDFRKVKSKDALVTAPPFAGRTLDSLSATGLQVNGTVYATLSTDMQTALTRLKTDLQNINSKSNVTNNLIGDLVKDMRVAANSATPPSVESLQALISLVYTATADGEISDKEKILLLAAVSDVVATTGLSSTSITAIQDDVNAIIAASGVNANDIALIKADLASILNLLKN